MSHVVGSPDRHVNVIGGHLETDGGGTDTGHTESIILTFAAAVPLSARRVVTPQANGTLVYADNSNPDHIDQPLYLTVGAIAVGDTGEVIAFGKVTELTWNWTPSLLVFLGTSGQLTQTPPTSPDAAFLIEVARVQTPTTLLYDAKLPIALAA